MKRVFVALGVMLALTACNEQPTPTEVAKLQETYPPVRIAVLPDGTEVWRVADRERWVYVATHGGNVNWTTRRQCGKGCTLIDYHQTVSP